MLELRPNCECCDADLPPDSPDARICSFECTFCVACVEGTLGGKCPNCGGELVRRPVRPAEKLVRFPASTTRKLKAGGCTALIKSGGSTALAALLAIGLAACAETAATQPKAAPTPGGVSGDFEVLYRGASTRFQADARTCPSPGLVTIRPDNGVFTYRLGGRILIETTIIGDGTLAGNAGDYTVTGTATADKIEGDVQSSQCGYHFRAVRKR